MTLTRLVFVAVPLALMSTHSMGQSFRCEDATTRIERAICGDSQLALLDVELADNFGRAVQAAPGMRDSLRGEQRRWIVERNRTCGAIDKQDRLIECVNRAYVARNAQLAKLTRAITRPDTQICKTVAAQLAATPRDLEWSALALLRGNEHKAIAIVKLAGLQAWAAKQAPPLTIPADVASRFEEIGNVYGTWTLEQLPGTEFYALHSIDGTMHCYSSLYFVIIDGQWVMQKEPPGIESEGGGGCMVSRTFGKVDDTSVMFEELYTGSPAMESWLTIATWDQDRFARACRISFQYEPVLSPADRNTSGECTPQQCGDLQKAALMLTTEVQRGPGKARDAYWKALSRSALERFQAAASLIQALGPESEQNDPAQLTDETPLRLPYDDGQKLYVVSAGHETIGWRNFARWQVVFHEIVDDRLIKQGTFAVDMSKGAIKTMEINAR
jgi:uncharacterized protein